MKRIISLFFAAVIFAVSGAFAAADAHYVCDYSATLNSEEKAALENKLGGMSAELNVEILVVTDSAAGVSPRSYADDFADRSAYGNDVILLFVDTSSRDWYISTKGYGITAVTDAGRGYMADRFVPYLSDGDYHTAFETYADLCYDFVNQARNGRAYDSGNLPKDKFNFALIPLFFVIGAVIALIVCLVWRAQLKSVRARNSAVDYIRRGSFRVTRSHDIYLYSRLERHARPKQSSGSSTHTSSSGSTHGGGGGKF